MPDAGSTRCRGGAAWILQAHRQAFRRLSMAHERTELSTLRRFGLLVGAVSLSTAAVAACSGTTAPGATNAGPTVQAAATNAAPTVQAVVAQAVPTVQALATQAAPTVQAVVAQAVPTVQALATQAA